MHIKKLLLAGVGAILALSASPQAFADELTFVRIASGSAGGSSYPIAGLVANAVSNPPGSRPCEKGGACGMPGLIAVAQTANGSVANVNAIQSGSVETGFATAGIIYQAYTGTGVFADTPKKDKLRLIANLYPEQVHISVRADSPYKNIADLKGKTISVLLKGSNGNVIATQLLSEYGFTAGTDYTPEFLNSSQSSERLQDNQLDGWIMSTGYPQAAVSRLASTAGVRLLSIPNEIREKMIASGPHFYTCVIPKGTYEKVDYDVDTLCVGAQWVTSVDLDDKVVYEMTKALWHKNTRKLLDRGHAKAKGILKENAVNGLGIPLHPGAERYYKEAGLIK